MSEIKIVGTFNDYSANHKVVDTSQVKDSNNKSQQTINEELNGSINENSNEIDLLGQRVVIIEGIVSDDALNTRIDEKVDEAVSDEETRATDAESSIRSDLLIEKARAEDAEETLRVAYQSITQSDILIRTSLPTVTAETESNFRNKIVRVVGSNNYSDYMLKNTISDYSNAFQLMATYNNGVDDVPTTGSNNFVKSGGIKASISEIQDTIDKKLSSVLTRYTNLPYGLLISGVFGSDSSYKHVAIEVQEDNKYIIENTSASAVKAIYGFGTSNSYASSGDIPLMTGTTLVSVPVKSYEVVTIPAGCSYLLVNSPSSYSVKIYKYESVILKDGVPTKDSINSVESGGVFDAIQEAKVEGYVNEKLNLTWSTGLVNRSVGEAIAFGTNTNWKHSNRIDLTDEKVGKLVCKIVFRTVSSDVYKGVIVFVDDNDIIVSKTEYPSGFSNGDIYDITAVVPDNATGVYIVTGIVNNIDQRYVECTRTVHPAAMIDDINEKLSNVDENLTYIDDSTSIRVKDGYGKIDDYLIDATTGEIRVDGSATPYNKVFYFKVNEGDTFQFETDAINTATSARSIKVGYLLTKPQIGDIVDDLQVSVSVEKHSSITTTSTINGYIVLSYYTNNCTFVAKYSKDLKEMLPAVYNSFNKFKHSLKVLCIGDSWGRDTMREFWGVAADAGISDLVVGQAYQGACSLYSQYTALSNNNYYYYHSSWYQYVYGNYQYWKYTSPTPTLTPTAYNNGKTGVAESVSTPSGTISVYGRNNGAWVGKSLAQILSDEDWDIILIRLSYVDLIIGDKLTMHDSTRSCIDINDFITAMEEMLTPESLAKVKWGLTNTWTYPEGCTREIRTDEKIGIMERYSLTEEEYEELSATQKNEYRDVIRADYDNLRKNFSKVAMHIGNKCKYLVNTSLAINLARSSKLFEDVGYKLIRTSSDTHLAEGLPKYICAAMLCYELLGLTPADIEGNYLPGLDSSGQGGDSSGSMSYTLTTSRLEEARKVAWEAYCKSY